MKDVAKRFGKVQCVEMLGGFTEDEEDDTSPEGETQRIICYNLFK